MKKIISIYTYGTLAVSAFMAPFLAMCELKLLPTCIWVTAVLIAAVFVVGMCEEEKEKVIDPGEVAYANAKKKVQSIHKAKRMEKKVK